MLYIIMYFKLTRPNHRYGGKEPEKPKPAITGAKAHRPAVQRRPHETVYIPANQSGHHPGNSE